MRGGGEYIADWIPFFVICSGGLLLGTADKPCSALCYSVSSCDMDWNLSKAFSVTPLLLEISLWWGIAESKKDRRWVSQTLHHIHSLLGFLAKLWSKYSICRKFLFSHGNHHFIKVLKDPLSSLHWKMCKCITHTAECYLHSLKRLLCACTGLPTCNSDSRKESGPTASEVKCCSLTRNQLWETIFLD